LVREFQDGQPDRQILANISVTGKVRCDLGRVQQVASNLIGNALKHGAPLYLLSNRARSRRQPVRDVHAGKRHQLYCAPAVKFQSA
jgi:signal transduction histidine kinase